MNGANTTRRCTICSTPSTRQTAAASALECGGSAPRAAVSPSTRIYEPSKDAHTGLLVPVWDFFGTRKTETEYDGESYSDTTDYPTWSYLTINAVDGSIIDRSLGY